MKSFEQLARIAYEAACKRALEMGIREEGDSAPWDQLDPGCKETWIAAAQQLWTEFTTTH